MVRLYTHLVRKVVTQTDRRGREDRIQVESVGMEKIEIQIQIY
jgi:hypothetical protein